VGAPCTESTRCRSAARIRLERSPVAALLRRTSKFFPPLTTLRSPLPSDNTFPLRSSLSSLKTAPPTTVRHRRHRGGALSLLDAGLRRPERGARRDARGAGRSGAGSPARRASGRHDPIREQRRGCRICSSRARRAPSLIGRWQHPREHLRDEAAGVPGGNHLINALLHSGAASMSISRGGRRRQRRREGVRGCASARLARSERTEPRRSSAPPHRRSSRDSDMLMALRGSTRVELVGALSVGTCHLLMTDGARRWS
jgi:hypothetical protein